MSINAIPEQAIAISRSDILLRLRYVFFDKKIEPRLGLKKTIIASSEEEEYERSLHDMQRAGCFFGKLRRLRKLLERTGDCGTQRLN